MHGEIFDKWTSRHAKWICMEMEKSLLRVQVLEKEAVSAAKAQDAIAVRWAEN